jgi:Mrp family chromosome partitioning ATPase
MRIRSNENQVIERLDDEQDGSSEAMYEASLNARTRVSPLVQVALDPDDPVARLARSLRMSFSAFALQSSKPVRSVAILSVDAAAEASVLTMNLAVSYAQAGASTVLVDANIGHDRQRRLFGIDENEGIAGALAARTDARSIVMTTPIRNLSVLTAGSGGGDATILLDGERFHRRIMPLLDTYGMMVVDSAVPFEDPSTLCESIDAAAILVRRNVTSVDAVRHIVKRLDDMNTHVIGTLIAE